MIWLYGITFWAAVIPVAYFLGRWVDKIWPGRKPRRRSAADHCAQGLLILIFGSGLIALAVAGVYATGVAIQDLLTTQL